MATLKAPAKAVIILAVVGTVGFGANFVLGNLKNRAPQSDETPALTQLPVEPKVSVQAATPQGQMEPTPAPAETPQPINTPLHQNAGLEALLNAGKK